MSDVAPRERVVTARTRRQRVRRWRSSRRRTCPSRRRFLAARSPASSTTWLTNSRGLRGALRRHRLLASPSRLPEGTRARRPTISSSAPAETVDVTPPTTGDRVLRGLDLPHRELQGMPFYAHGYASAGLRRLSEFDPDIVHLQNVSQFLPLARRLVPGAKLVLQMNCDWLRQLPPGPCVGGWPTSILSSARATSSRGRIAEAFPELADRCRTLYNGTDLELLPRAIELPPDLRELEADLRVRFGLGNGPVVLYVGGFAVEKGTVVLLAGIRARPRRAPGRNASSRRCAQPLLSGALATRVPHARRGRPAAEGLPAGSRTARDSGSASGSSSRPGAPHDQLAAYYALADVYTMPSTGPEPFSLTVPEAMGCGLPVVGTAHGGTVEIVDRRRHRPPRPAR